MKEYEFHKVSELFPLIEGKEFKELVEDIKKQGLLESIWIYDGKIVDGRNRYRACKEAGVEPSVRIWDGNGSLVSFIVSLNLNRRHLTKAQAACVAIDALPMYEAEAEERMKHEGNTYGKIATGDLGKARDFASEDFHVAARYIQDAKKIKEEAPEEFEQVKIGKKKITQVVRELKKEKQLNELHELKPVEGKFNVIVIDPPWNIGEYSSEGFRGGATYPTMTIEEIKAIDLPAEENCILWFWAVDTFLDEALEIIKQWGFERKGTLIWDKESIGLGKWLRRQHEYCFLAVKGNSMFFGENARSVIRSKRTKHSEKPDDFYKLVEDTCKYKSKLDYFSRKKRDGWVCYGDEVK